MAELIEYKCPCCAGAIKFDSSVQKMKCPYCDTEFEMETLKAYDEDLKTQQGDAMDWGTMSGSQWQEGEAEQMAVYICNSCSGEVICDQTTAAMKCPYCDSPIVMKGNVSGALRPDYVIPFKLDKNTAIEALKKHMKGKKLLPKAFKDENHLEEIRGVYVPFWLFNADVNANGRYKATRLRSWSDSNYIYRETKYYSVLRSGRGRFEQVPVDGSSKMPDDLMESLEPYYFKDAVDFQTAYLAGYLADKYDVDSQQSVERANGRVKNTTERLLRETVKGYSSVIKESGNVQLENGKAHYALYPVWILNTVWKDEKFLFAMNGQTGKFVGDLPVDWGAFFKWFGSLTAIISAATYGLMWLIHIL